MLFSSSGNGDSSAILALVASIIFLAQSVASAMWSNPPGQRLYSPPRKLLAPLSWLVATVGCLFLFIVQRIGLFIFYGALALLAGEASLRVIESWRKRETPVELVHIMGYFLLLISNAMFVFEDQLQFRDFASALAFAGASLLLAANSLGFVAHIVRPSNDMADQSVIPQSLDAEEDVHNF